MKPLVHALVLMTLAALVFVAPHSARAADPAVKSVAVGTGYASGKVTGAATTFRPTNRKLVCALTLNKNDNGGRYKIAWIAVDAAGLKNYQIATTQPPRMNGSVLQTSLEMPRDFPTGKYRVDWYRDGKLLRSTAFAIK